MSEEEIKKYLESFEDSERFSDAIYKIVPFMCEYASQKNLEVEFRLGYIDDTTFESNIHSDFFNKIIKVFSDNKFKYEEINSVDTYSNNIRKSVTNGQEKLIKKVRLCNIDFNFIGTPFDIRISFSKETPVKKFEENEKNYVREKFRRTYTYKLFNYDFTEVSYTDNMLTQKNYEIELEINKPLSKILKGPNMIEEACKLVHSGLLKIADITRICEKDINDSEVKFVRSKVFN